MSPADVLNPIAGQQSADEANAELQGGHADLSRRAGDEIAQEIRGTIVTAGVPLLAKARRGATVVFKSFTTANFRENLGILIGRSLSSKEVAHHIVAKAAPIADESRRILAKFQIDVNDPSKNGIALSHEFHSGMHSEDYYRWVNSRIKDAKSREEVESILEDIGRTLQKGETPWKKCAP
jgi:hypothetical protein